MGHLCLLFPLKRSFLDNIPMILWTLDDRGPLQGLNGLDEQCARSKPLRSVCVRRPMHITISLWSFWLIPSLSYLSSVCAPDNNWKVTSPGNTTYAPPANATANMCQCNTVAYSLMEACGYCQGARIGDWKLWITNCPASYISDQYTLPVPPQTVIPPWAFLDPKPAGSWDPAVARQYAGKLSTTGGKRHWPMLTASTLPAFSCQGPPQN